jgi:hypothetical protein
MSERVREIMTLFLICFVEIEVLVALDVGSFWPGCGEAGCARSTLSIYIEP